MTSLPSERQRKIQKRATFLKLSHKLEIAKKNFDSLMRELGNVEMKNQKEWKEMTKENHRQCKEQGTKMTKIAEEILKLISE